MKKNLKKKVMLAVLAGGMLCANGALAANVNWYGKAGNVWTTKQSSAVTSGLALTLTPSTTADGVSWADVNCFYGGYTAGNYTVFNNSLTIALNRIQVNAEIYAGYSGNGEASGNKLIINSGTIKNYVYGGYSYYTGYGPGSGKVSKNEVTINSGTITGEVYGGFSAVDEVSENKLFINNVTIVENVYGGRTGDGVASKNEVTINNSTITGEVYGGYTKAFDDAIGNEVTIKNGTISNGLVSGGYSYMGNATDNSITIEGGTFNNVTLYGGSCGNGKTSSGNTLNLKTVINGTIKEIAKFQNVNFTIPAGNATMLTLANAVNLNGVAVNVYLNGQEPDTITLIDNVKDNGTYKVYTGSGDSAELTDDYTISVDNNSLVLKITKVLWYTVGDEKHKFLPSAAVQSISDTSGNAVVLHRGAGNANEYTGINITGALTVGAETTTGKSFLVSGDLTANGGVTVATKNTLNVAASNLKSAVTNNGTVNLGAGTLASGNTITGGTLNINDNVTANAGDIAGNTNTVAENKTLTFNGGTLTHKVTGEGTLKFTSNMEINADNAAAATNIVNSGVTLTVNGGTFDKKLDGSGTLNITGTLHYGTNAELVAADTQKVGGRDIPVSNVNVTIAQNGVMDMKDRQSTPGGCINTLTFSGGKLDLSGGYVGNLLIAKTLDAAGGGSISFDVSNAGSDQIGVLTNVTEGSKLTLDTINVKGELAGEVIAQGYAEGSITFALDLTGGSALNNLTILGQTTTIAGNYMYTFTSGANGQLNYRKEMGMGIKQVIQAKDINDTHNDSYAKIATYSFTGERGMNFEPYSANKIAQLTGEEKTKAENLNKRFGDLGVMGHATYKVVETVTDPEKEITVDEAQSKVSNKEMVVVGGGGIEVNSYVSTTARTLTIVGNGSELSGGTYEGVTVGNRDTLVLKNISAVTDAKDNKIATNNGMIIFTGTGTTNVKASVDGTGKLIVDGVNVVLGENYQYVKGRQELTAEELAELKDKTGKTEIEQKEYEFGWKLNSYGSYVTTLSENTSASITQKDLEISSGSLTANASNLHITNGIVNNGEMTFTGGTLSTSLTGAGQYINTGSLTVADASKLQMTKAFKNTGTLELQGGNLGAEITDITSAAGTTIISGTVTNTGGKEIFQKNLNIASGGNFTTSANTIYSVEVINDNGNLNLTGGKLERPVQGTGNITFSGDVTTIADNIATTGTNTVETGKKLILDGGTLTQKVQGPGNLNFTGDVTTNAENVATTGINEVATGVTVTFTDGAVGGDISGAGKVAIGDGQNEQTVNSDAGNFANTGDLTVNTKGILNLTAGTVNRAINNNGTVKLNGATLGGAYVTAGILEFAQDISVNADYVKATVNKVDSDIVLTLNADAVNRAITNNGTVKLNGATLGGAYVTGGTLEFAANASYAGSYLTGNVNRVDSGVTLTLTDEKLPANASIENHGTVDLTGGNYDENFVTNAKDSGTVNLNGTAVYQTTAGKVFTVGDATVKTGVGAVRTDEEGSTANLLKLVSGTLTLTDELYSLKYLVSATGVLRVYEYDGTNSSKTKLIMLGTPVEKEISIDDLKSLDENVVLNNVEVSTGSDKKNLIIGEASAAGYDNAILNGFGAGSLNLGADSDKVTITNGEDLTLGGTKGGTIIKVNGKEKNVNVTVGNGIDASTFNIGNEAVSPDTEYRLPGSVNVANGSAVNIRGKTEITGNLNMAGGEVAVAKGASLIVNEIALTEDATENVKVSGKVETGKLAGKSGKVITVGNANAAGHVSAKDTKLNGGTLFLDPAWKNGVGIEGASNFATETTTLDGKYIAGQNSVISFGTNDGNDVVNFVNRSNSGIDWSESGITAAVYVAKTVNVTNGAIYVDGSLTEESNPLPNPENGSVTLKDKSLLMVNTRNLTDNTAITGVSTLNTPEQTGKKATIYLRGARTGQDIYITDAGAATLDLTNLTLAGLGANFAASASLDGTKLKVHIDKGSLAILDETVIPNVGNALETNGNEDAAAFLDKVSMMTDDASAIQAVNSVANLGENLGVSRGAYDVANMVGDAIDKHWDDNRVQDSGVRIQEKRKVWAVGTRNKETLDGVELGGMEAQYDAQYNGAVVGVNWSGNFGMAINYTDGKVNNKLGGHNDAEYYGGSLYAKTDWGNLRITADATYTYGKNELSQNGITADAKTETISGGLTLKYMAKAGLNKIGPFAGIRYMHIKGRDYTDSLGINREADTINSMVVPVGLEYTAEFKMPKSEWTWKPMLMAGYLFNLGDRTNDMFLSYNNAMDSFAYDFVDKGAFFAKAGMAFEKKNFSLGISYDFMKSKNSKNRRWNVNADVAF